MRMSTRGRYGLRLMLDIAMNMEKGPVSLREIAARQEISEKYLEQITIRLSRAGLVQGTRGARGGYRLARASDEISVGDVLRAVEGSLEPVECVGENYSCDRAESCMTIELWRDIKTAVEKVVDQKTLADLVRSYQEKRACAGADFSCVNPAPCAL